MGNYWSQLGQQVVGQAAQGAMGIGIQRLGANYDRKQQLKTQEKMMALQMRGMKEMSEFEQQQQLELWEATGAPEQMKLLKKAGLNPALMYGGSGAGGQTVGHGASSPGGGQAGYVDTTGAGMALAMNLKMQQAQIKLMESQARKTDVEADVAGGVGKEKIETEIKGLLQGIESQKAQAALTKSVERLNQLEFNIKEQSMEDVLQTIHSNMYRALHEAHIAMNEAGISDETKQDKIKLIKGEAAGVYLKNALIKMQTQATGQSIQESKKHVEKMDAEIKKMSEEIAQNWQNLDRQERELKLKGWSEEIKAKYPGIWNVGGRMLNELANGIGYIFGQKADTDSKPNTDKK